VSAHPEGLLNDLSNCAGAACVDGADRVLRIVGMQLAQHGLGDLFETIFAAVLDGARPGDGRRFRDRWTESQEEERHLAFGR
jgi:hypothetical protein